MATLDEHLEAIDKKLNELLERLPPSPRGGAWVNCQECHANGRTYAGCARCGGAGYYKVLA